MLTEFKDIVQKLIVYILATNSQKIDKNIPFSIASQASKIYYIQGESLL